MSVRYSDTIPIDAAIRKELAMGYMQDAAEALLDMKERAYISLQTEFIRAWLKQPKQVIHTPGFFIKNQPLCDVVLDSFHGERGDDDLAEMMAIVAEVSAQGGDLGLRANSLICKLAAAHAEFHAEDAAGGAA